MGFFLRPYNFSFKDALAVIFSSSFLYFCWKVLDNQENLELVKTLVPLIGGILGGYFVQEGASMWFQRTQPKQTDESGGG